MGNLFTSREQPHNVAALGSGATHDESDLYVPAEATRLRDQARQLHGPERDKLFHQAAELVFKKNNDDKHRPPNEVDLHGLYREEALDYAQKKLELVKSKGYDKLVFIVGRGNHSADHKPVLKGAVDDLLSQSQLRHEVGVPNDGCITVYLPAKKSWCNVM